MLSCLDKIKRNTPHRPNSSPYITDITLLVDRSGSMYTMGDSVIQGVENFVKEQKNDLSEKKITIVSFDDQKEIVPGFDNCNIHKSPEIDNSYFTPRGMTRLIDTSMEEIQNQQKRKNQWYRKLPNQIKKLNPEYKNIFALMTDGEDNKSIIYSSSDMKDYLHKLQKEKNITCYFLGANQDAINTGNMYGFIPGNSLTYSNQPDTALKAIQSLSNGVSRAISGDHYIGFTKLQRQSSITSDFKNNKKIPNMKLKREKNVNFQTKKHLNNLRRSERIKNIKN